MKRTGRIEVICGPMFSGKSEELLRRLKRARIAKKKYQLFKPAVDDRYSESEVVSHSGDRMKCHVLKDWPEFLYAFEEDAEIIAFDEAQFFNYQFDWVPLLATLSNLANTGKRVIIAGLDMDSQGKPFGPMPKIMAIAEEVTKLTAVCEACGEPATHTYRLAEGKTEQVLVGAGEHYQARCRKHWSCK